MAKTTNLYVRLEPGLKEQAEGRISFRTIRYSGV